MTEAAESTEKQRPGTLRKLSLSLGVLVLCLVAVELGLRLYGFSYHLFPERIQFGYPEPEKFEKGFFLPHDRFLWVSRTYPGRLAAAQADPPDVVMLGCSCTEWGEIDQGLERVARRAGTPLKIANFGISGWSTFSGRNQLDDDVVPLKPKIVTIYFGWNDHWMGFGIEDKTVAELTASPVKQRLQKLRLVQWISKQIVGRKSAGDRTLGEGARPERVSLPDFKANLRHMVEAARANGITPVLITAPDAYVEGEVPEYLETKKFVLDRRQVIPLHHAYADAVREVAAERDVVLCDLAAEWDALPRETLLKYMKADAIHLTQEFGGPAAGRVLFETLVENGLL